MKVRFPSPVAVTALGQVSPLGLSPLEHLESVRAARSGIGPMERFDVTGHKCTTAAPVREFDLCADLRLPKNHKYMTRAVQCAVRAALDAVRTSGFPFDSTPPERLALYAASGQTGLEYDEFFRALSLAWAGDREHDFKYLGGRASRLIDPYFSLRTLSNVGIALLSAELEFRGSSANFVHGETAFVAAMQSACYDLIEDRCDAALVGAYDSLLRPSLFLSYEEAGLLSPSRADSIPGPFDIGRNGLVLGEGAGFFLLERVEDARARGAAILGTIRGLVCSMTVGDGSIGADATRAIRHAAEEFSADGVPLDYVVARGIGTLDGDLCEAGLIRDSVGERVPVTALKGATGYTGAASCAIELGIGLLCSRELFLPAIARCEAPDPLCSVNLVTTTQTLARDEPTGLFLSRAWGGQIAGIIASAARD